MIVTKHLLEQFVSLSEIQSEQIIAELSKIGLEVESFTPLRVPDLVVVGYVVEKSPHPDADKLSVCKVDVGGEILQIVCGASNVQSDQYVAVALEGAKLDTPKGELVIKPTTLRGVESCGMLCSSVELGFPKINDGIMLLDCSVGHLEVGTPLNSYPLFDNFILEVGLTPNRGDCLSVLGVARDLSVALNLTLSLKNYKDENVPLGIGRVLQVVNEGKFDSSMLYKVIKITSMQTPLEVKLSLALCGLQSHSPIQDYLNYAMHNIGVILRGYAFSHFEKSNLANNVEGQIVLKQNEQGLDCVYGKDCSWVVGISPTPIEPSNEMLVLEASYIAPQIVAETLYQYPQIKKDASLTYKTSRGSNPDLLLGMQYLCNLFISYTRSEVYSGNHKLTQKEESKSIKTTFDCIAQILGTEICKEEIAIILKKLGFKIEASFDESFFMATPPAYRHDIHTYQDIAEEVLRIYRIDKLTPKPLMIVEQSRKDNAKYFAFKAQRALIQKAVAKGFYESMHYVFDDRAKMQELGIEGIDESLDVLNPITNELNTLRVSLLPAMIESIKTNENFGIKKIAFAEIGVCYTKERKEVKKLAFATNLCKSDEAFPYPKGEEWDFYSFASSIMDIIGSFEVRELESIPFGTSSSLLHPYQRALVIKEGKEIGLIAKLNPTITKGFVCELDLESLIALVKLSHKVGSKFQASLRDLTLMIDKNITFSCIREELLGERIKFLDNLYPLDLYSQEDFGDEVALSIRFVWQSMEKTLQEEEITQGMQKVLEVLQEKFKARLR